MLDIGVLLSPESQREVCVCVYLRLWRTRLPADSVSSAASPLSSEPPCTWSRTTTTEGTFPEIQSKSNVIRKMVQLGDRVSPLYSAVRTDEASFGPPAVIEFIFITAVLSVSYQKEII